jgi:hypothetical protein
MQGLGLHLRIALRFTPLAHACLLLYGCATAGPRTWKTAPPLDLAISAGMSESDALQGRRLYIWKCAKCHALYDPGQYEDAEWDLWMRKMSEKARLSSAETQVLSRYLGTFRTANLQPSP